MTTEYDQIAASAGAFDADQKLYIPEMYTFIGFLLPRFDAWLERNRGKLEPYTVRVQDYHRGYARIGNALPATVGYDEQNTYHMVYDGDDLQQLLGGDVAIRKMGLQPQRLMYRLQIQPPGSVIPWHVDSMQKWRDQNEDIHPQLYTPETADTHGAMTLEEAKAYSKTDEGLIGRRIVQISTWEIGHVIQMGHSFVPPWSSGMVFDSPPGLWHLTANVGIWPRISIIVTGLELT